MSTNKKSFNWRSVLCFVLSTAFLLELSLYAGEKEGMLSFITKRSSQARFKVPRKVLAFYYTWYGTLEEQGRWIHWNKIDRERHSIATSTHYPAGGPYDSHKVSVIDRHIRQARESGVDCFICTWWGQADYTDRAFEKVLQRSAVKDFEVSLYWETAPGSGAPQVTKAVDDLLYMLKRYGDKPAFLKVKGAPVIFVYGRVMNQLTIRQWQEIINRVQSGYQKDFLLIADGYSDLNARLFDGIHTYNICGWVQKKPPSVLRETARKSFQEAVTAARNHSKLSCLTIIPGYDDTKIRTPGINAERMDGSTYRILWKEAIAADPDWVLITSWNEWHEGSEIEPSYEYGNKYLTLTGTYAEHFKKTLYSSDSVRRKSSPVPKQMRAAIQKAFKGKKIGILPGFKNDCVLWLAECGVALAELEPADVVDPNLFNAKRIPVTVYAGYEEYIQTVHKQGDVDAALFRYLKEGGLLMVLPAGPAPFNYNEKGEGVAAAGRWGLFIRVGGLSENNTLAGWEQPPENTELFFELNTDVFSGLPSKAPFPTGGDLRWRPSVKQNLGDKDIYLPLAQLHDTDGRTYGDGIVYIEHKETEPVNGKLLYSWMRMGDVFDRNKFLYALFAYASEKL